MIKSDATLTEYRADTYSYQTAIFELPFGIRLPSIDELALGLATEIESKYPKNRRIVLVCHSMGGLVARKFLLDLARQGLSIERYSLLMFGTPNSGALLPRMAAKVGLKPKQLNSMGLGDTFIPALNEGWRDLGIADRMNIRYVIGGGDQIVTPLSAGFSAGDSRVEVAIDLDHFSLVDVTKPLPFAILKRFLELGAPGNSDPLFVVYHLHDEPYYAVRSNIDGPLAKSLSTSHIWLHGESGVGKTSLMRRNALMEGWRLKSVSLSSTVGNTKEAIVGAFLDRCADALDQDPFPSAEAFVKACGHAIRQGPLCFLVEEIPFASADVHEDIASWFAMLADLLDQNIALRGRVRLAFTSLASPINHESVVAQRVRDRMVVMRAPLWSISDLEYLAEFAAKNAEIKLNREELVTLVASAEGRPRNVKLVLRDIRTRPDVSLSIEDRLGEVLRG